MGWQLIAELPWFLTLGFYVTVLKVALGLGLVIFVHELGHFLVAKMCGVQCDKFYIGFDVPIRIGPIRFPSKLGSWQWGETEYGIGIIPLGGYVKMLGQDDNPANAAKEAERIRLEQEETDSEGTDEAEGEDNFELDPRSYPAKSVPARMAIISAGVIMNMIFAGIFAAIAFRLGVPFTPCEIGRVSPGSPAWKHDLRGGDKIIQLGRKGNKSEYLQFDWDLMQNVAQSGIGKEIEPLDLHLRQRSGKELWLKMMASDYLIKHELTKFVTLGVSSVASTTLADPPAVSYHPASTLTDSIKPGDRIVGANGKLFDAANANEQKALPSWQLEDVLAANFDKPVNLMIERRKDNAPDGPVTEHEIIVPPNPLLTMGIICAVGPLHAVQIGSPAATAGMKAGDQLVSIDGKPIGDPLTLQQRLYHRAGESVKVVVSRQVSGKKTTMSFDLVIRNRNQFTISGYPASLIAIDTLGISFPVENEVVEVVAGSSAAAEGIKVGDELLSAQFVVPENDIAVIEELFTSVSVITREQPLGPVPSWVFLNDTIQQLPPSIKIKLSVRSTDKGGKERQVTLASKASDDAFAVHRGFRFEPFQRIQRADSWSSAFGLGLRFTGRKFYQVLEMVKKLVTGQWSPKFLGGPVAIATIAGREANQGATRLLLFLTFLSVNLAILNFMPVPALDGGHMVFLTIEGITGKPVKESVQVALTMVGVMLLLTMIVLVTFNDIVRTVQALWQ